MELHIVFDAATEPRKQPGLKAVPSSSIVDHAEIKTELECYEKALANEHQARLAAVQAEQDVGEADDLDAVALADALAASKRDPGASHREAALRLVEDTRRQHRAAIILLQRSVEGVSAAFAEHGDDYERALDDRYDALREQAESCLGEFLGHLGELRRTRACLQIGGSATVSPFDRVVLPGKKASGEQLTLSPEEIVEQLRALGGSTEPRSNRQPDHRLGAHQPTRAQLERAAMDPDASALTQQRRLERLERKADRAAERQARLEAEEAAIEAVR